MYKETKVLIFGLGLNDGGVGMAEYFTKQGALVTVTDLKTEKQLKSSIEKLSKYQNIKYRFGQPRKEDFLNNDIIVRNPAIKTNNPFLKLARDNGKKIIMEMAFFHKHAKCPIIGVTGTRGKSTTTTLIYEIMKEAHKGTVLLGGNIGKSAVRELDTLQKEDLAILELSSFQLDGMGEMNISPQTAVITNIYSDHLDWHADMDDYINAKKNIFLHQNKNDNLILNLDNEITKSFINDSKGQVFTFSLEDKDANYFMNSDLSVLENGNPLLQLENLKLQGRHNLYNILAAIATVRSYNVNTKTIEEVIIVFEGIPCRQEFVRKVCGVSYYNDTCATSAEAVIAMFDRFSKDYKGKIVMIAGGVDKGVDYERFKNLLNDNIKALILLEGSASEKIAKLVEDKDKLHKYFNNMQDAVGTAAKVANNGDIVILCPSASSFNMFENEFDRGNQFVKYVNQL